MTVVTRGVFNEDEKLQTNLPECWSQDNMERIDKIRPSFMEMAHGTAKEAEKDRIFCKHGIEHLLDVARIAYIENLEQNCGVSKEWIYTAALLHDIGRFLQYSKGNIMKAGAELKEILKDCGFKQEEKGNSFSNYSSQKYGNETG